MKKYSFWISSVFLFLAACGGKVDENLATLSSALEVPEAGGSRRHAVATIDKHHVRLANGMVHRVASDAGCHTVNASHYMGIAVVLPKLMLCMFGAMEEGGVIDRPSGNSTYNYYSFDSSRLTGREDSGTMKIRYGNDASGNLNVSMCQGSTAAFEMAVTNSGDDATITITGETGFGRRGDGVFSFAVTAERGSDKYSFKKGTMQLGQSEDRGFSGYFSVEKSGANNIITERFSDSRETIILYSIFDESQGATKISNGARVSFVESWTNDEGYACLEPQSSGTHFATVTDTDLSTIGTVTTPSFNDPWDCTGDFETPNLVGKQEVGQDVLNCLSEGDLDIDFESCGSLSSTCS